MNTVFWYLRQVGQLIAAMTVIVAIFSCDNTIKGHLGLGSEADGPPVLNDFSGQGSDFFISSSSYSVIWSLAKGQAKEFEVTVYADRNCQGTVQQTLTTKENQLSLSGLQDSQVYSIKVIALNESEVSDPICSTNVVIDLQDPQVTITVPSSSVVQGGNQFAFSWVGHDLGLSGLHVLTPYKLELFSNGSCSGSSQSTLQQLGSSYTWSGLSDGSYSLRVTAMDVAGNESIPQCSGSVTMNNSLATLSLSEASSSIGFSRNLLVDATIGSDSAASKWCLSESQVTAPANGSSSCAGGGGPSSGWYMARPSTLTLGGADGTKTVYLWLADGSDVVGSTAVTASIVLDRVEPVGTCSGLTGSINVTSVSPTVGCSDAVSGCSQTECRLDGGSWSATCGYSSLGEAAHTVDVRGTDNAGNVQSSSYGTCSFTVDTTPPTATLSGTPTDPSSDASLNVTVGGMGVTHYRYKLGIGIDCSLASGYSSETDISIPITDSVATVGSYSLCVVGRDLAGNYQAYPGTQYTWSRVNNLPPVITAPSDRVFPLDGSSEPEMAQNSLSLVATAIDPESNTPITWPSCVYQTLGLHSADPNYSAPGTSCSSLPSYTLTNGVYLPGGTASFSNGTLSWIPTVSQRGTYQFTVTAQDSLSNSSSKSFVVQVRDPFSANQLVYALDSLFSTDTTQLTGVAAIPRLDGTGTDNLSNWLDLKSSATFSLASMSSSPWQGDGTYSSPYSLNFNGTTDLINMGPILNSFTKMRFSTWVKPSSATNSTIFSNASSSKGFEIRHGITGTSGKVVLTLGDSTTIKTYREEVMADSPTGYWTLDEPYWTASSVTAIKDSSGANYCGGNPCDLELPSDNSHPDLGQLTTMSSKFLNAVWFDGADDGSYDVLGGFSYGIHFDYSDCSGTDEAFTLEAWINLASDYSSDGAIMASHNNGNVTRGYVFGVNAAKKLYMRLFDMDSDSKRIGRLYNTALAVGTWYHVVMTYDGSETNGGIKLYLNGARVDDTNDSAGVYTGNRYCVDFTIGRQLGGVDLGFKGYIDEAAVYTGQLTSTRILAHYNSAVTNSYLVSNSDLSTTLWNQITALYDGTLVSFFLNGQQIGSLTPPGGWDPNGASDVHLGNSSLNTSFWGGALADFKLFGSSDGSSVGSATTIGSDFQLEANRYRSKPVENIKLSNLILHLDAANANRGTANYAVDTGCSSNLIWDSMQGFGEVKLDSFTSCGTYGWKGDGFSTNPYRLKFDGVASGVRFDDLDVWSFTDGAGNDLPFSIETWIRFSSFSTSPNIFSMDSTSGWPIAEYYVWADSSRYPYFELIDSDSSAVIGRRGTTQLTTNTWYQLVVTYSSSESETGIKIYVNGTEQSYVSTTNGNFYSGMNNTDSTLKIGKDWGTTYVVNGDISIVRIYSSALSITEILQNCHAQKARFSGVTCPAP